MALVAKEAVTVAAELRVLVRGLEECSEHRRSLGRKLCVPGTRWIFAARKKKLLVKLKCAKIYLKCNKSMKAEQGVEVIPPTVKRMSVCRPQKVVERE
jgi:hypothetical protein